MSSSKHSQGHGESSKGYLHLNQNTQDKKNVNGNNHRREWTSQVITWGDDSLNRYIDMNCSITQRRMNNLLMSKPPHILLGNSFCQAIGDDSIIQVSCGYNFVHLLTGKGRVLAYGNNITGQLGIGTDKHGKIVSDPVIIPEEYFSNENVIQIDSGFYHSIALTNSKPISDSKSSKNVGVQDDSKSCNNHVYTWGQNELGQLGLGDQIDRPFPNRVRFLQSDHIIKVSASFKSCFAITDSGKLYAWGDNMNYQLGIGSEFTHINVPQVVIPSMICDVSCRTMHTLALSTDGSVYSFGWNNFGQLGLGDRTSRTLPEKIQFQKTPISSKSDNSQQPSKIQKIYCGNCHSMALDIQGDVWVWGQNMYGQLGISNNTNNTVNMDGNDVDQKVVKDSTDNIQSDMADTTTSEKICLNPMKLNLPRKSRISHISCKGFHCFLLTENHDVIAFGSNKRGQILTKSTEEILDSPIDLTFLWNLKILNVFTFERQSFVIASDQKLKFEKCHFNSFTDVAFIFVE